MLALCLMATLICSLNNGVFTLFCASEQSIWWWNVLQPFKQVAPKSPHTHSCRSDLRVHTAVHVSAHAGVWAERLIDSERKPASWEERDSHRNTSILPQRGGTRKGEPCWEMRFCSGLIDVSPLKSHFNPQERKITNGISYLVSAR